VSVTRHNLSVTGTGQVRAASETRVCFFCHGSHLGTGTSNRPEPLTVLQGYRSTTMRSRSAAPSNGTRMCLSCHDGTVAVGNTLRGRVTMRQEARAQRGAALDLRRSHPVGMRPVESLTLRRPGKEEAVRLDPRGSVECTSCHDPHRESLDEEHKFLVAGNRESAICLSCHQLPGWGTGPSSHKSSPRPFTDAAGKTRLLIDAACAACHVNHGAAERGPLLRPVPGTSDDDLCLSCHDGRVGKNIAAEVAKPSAHAAARTSALHDTGEGQPGATRRLPETSAATPRHVTCVDCHEPHAASAQAQRAPFAQGALAGAWGVDRAGQRVASVRYEYEVCLKCHGDSANKPQGRQVRTGDPVRRKPDYNLRNVFDLSSPSFHPVAGPGKGADVPSLMKPLDVGSVIYCSDCHSSEAAGGPRGPHGSIYPKLLAAQLSTIDGTPEAASAYALCYRCHSREVLLSNGSAFNRHQSHVTGIQADRRALPGAPCTACHNPHGVSRLFGNATNNAHLVDFDTGIVKPNAAGLLEYQTTGPRTGSCALSCHGVEHTHAQSGYTAVPPSALRSLQLQQRQLGPLRGPATPAPPRKK
jgi:predicted CXXCH cytochrome family protein